ncbi:hypothetical protein, partial [Vibrio vulnificus]|uniref:hypothetical protein n=1 Tax=Vibrio vulnificus TaxID=672 RepID=UPI0040584101
LYAQNFDLLDGVKEYFMTLKIGLTSYFMPEEIKLMPTIILSEETPAIRQFLGYFTKHKMPQLILKTAFPAAEIVSARYTR